MNSDIREDTVLTEERNPPQDAALKMISVTPAEMLQEQALLLSCSAR